MSDFLLRTQMLIGVEGVEKLKKSHVAVLGIGGVGGSACAALVRAGIGSISLFDDDIVSESNLNRQEVAYISTLGMPKVEAMANLIADINPNCNVTKHKVFYLPQNAENYDFGIYDYVIDAVDTVSAKLEIITRAKQAGVPVISCMGAGNKLHPELFKVDDIHKTSVCPLARVMRRECKKRGIYDVKAVYSTELPLQTEQNAKQESIDKTQSRPGKAKQNVPASISFVPATAGLVLAGEVVRSLI